MSKIIGVIAEELNDVEVVEELIKKIIPGRKFHINRFLGHGCGKIIGKCSKWAETLKLRGCTSLIVLHDLDDNNLHDLYSKLENSLLGCAFQKRVVVIPIKEIEAWLLSDSSAIKKAMNLKKDVPHVANPQSIINPKKKLGEIIYLKSGKTKRYVNSKHNKLIASEINITNINKCPSFHPLYNFVQTKIK